MQTKHAHGQAATSHHDYFLRGPVAARSASPAARVLVARFCDLRDLRDNFGGVWIPGALSGVLLRRRNMSAPPSPRLTARASGPVRSLLTRPPVLGFCWRCDASPQAPYVSRAAQSSAWQRAPNQRWARTVVRPRSRPAAHLASCSLFASSSAPFPPRTHTCGGLSAQHAGARVVLTGWLLPERCAPYGCGRAPPRG